MNWEGRGMRENGQFRWLTPLKVADVTNKRNTKQPSEKEAFWRRNELFHADSAKLWSTEIYAIWD